MTIDYTALHNRDIERLDEALDKKVDKDVFDATVKPIRYTANLVIGALISIGTTIILAIVIPLIV